MSDPADTSRFWGRVHERVAQVVGRPRNWLLFSLMLGSYPLIHIATHPLPDPIPIFDKVEPFELVDHRGERIGLWRGRSPREEAIETCEVISAEFPDDRRAPDRICEDSSLPEKLEAACDACLKARDRGRLHVNLHEKIWVATVICSDCVEMDERTIKSIYKIQHHSRAMGKHFKIVSFTSQPDKDSPEVLAELGSRLKASRGMRSFVTGERAKIESVIDNIFNRQTATKRLKGAPQHNEHQVAIIDPGGFIRGYYDLRDEEDVTLCLRDIGLVVNRGF